MSDWQSQAHVRHYCKYHVVFVPKYRKKSIYGTQRTDIGGILRELCRQQGVELVEGYAMKDYIHMLLMTALFIRHYFNDVLVLPPPSMGEYGKCYQDESSSLMSIASVYGSAHRPTSLMVGIVRVDDRGTGSTGRDNVVPRRDRFH